MSYLRGMKVFTRALVGGTLVWMTVSCGEPASDGNSVDVQSALLAAAGSPGEPPPMPPDEIVGPFTQDLAGVSLTYRYSTGGDYYITYGTDTVTFRLPLPDGTHTPPITVPYYARKLRPKIYMVHWINPERTVHVTQVLDAKNREVNVSALMPGQWQLFDVGHVSEIVKPSNSTLDD
jgi:hypothetical protein